MRPDPWEFPHDSLASDSVRDTNHDLVCHLIEGHHGDHWDDYAEHYWRAEAQTRGESWHTFRCINSSPLITQKRESGLL